MTVKFITGYTSYHANDRAGFSPEKEKELVDNGIAVYTEKSMNKPPVDKMERGKVDKGFTCECGRTFDTKRGLSTHQRFCEEVGE